MSQALPNAADRPGRIARAWTRAFPLALMVGLLAAGCAGSPQAPTVTGSPGATTNYFDYRIDPAILGRYGTAGEVAWLGTGPGRPSILLLGEQAVTFAPWVTAADIERFAADFDAEVNGPVMAPGMPDGSVPPRATNVYRVTFRTENVSLTPLDAMLEANPVISGGWVFSSEAAAKTFLQTARVKQMGDQYKVAFIGFNMAMCVPEDCAPDALPVPAYPNTEPVPTPTPSPALGFLPMRIKDVVCLQSQIPQGRQGILHITGSVPELCWVVHEVKAIVDDERREVRLEATAKRMREVCQSSVGYPEAEVPFYPARLGTYRVIATLDDGGDKPRELSCEVEVVARE